MCFEENNRVGVAGEQKQKQKPEVCGAEPERMKAAMLERNPEHRRLLRY